MTVTTTLDRQYFDGDGSNKNFPFNFRFFDNSNIFVYLIGSDGSIVGQTLNVDYTLSGAMAPGGGQVIFSVSPPAGVKNVLVSRILPLVQPTSIRNQGAFFPAIHEDAFDRIVMLIQQVSGVANNSLQLSPGGATWDAKGSRIINVGDPLLPQDAATRKWATDYVASILSTGQGPINNSVNVIHVTPGNIFTTVSAKLLETVSLSDYATLRAALASGAMVHVPATVTDVSLSSADSPYVLPFLNRVSVEGPLNINLGASVHATAAGPICRVGVRNSLIKLLGPTPLETTASSVASITGVAGDWTITYNVASTSGAVVGDYAKLFDVGPLPILNGDNAASYILRSYPLKGELYTPLLQSVGSLTYAGGGGSVAFSAVSGSLSDYMHSGDLITDKGQTRVLNVIGGTSASIVGAWTNGGNSGSRSFYITRPNAGTIGTAGAPNATVTGVGTAFTTEANPGDVLLADGVMTKILTVVSGTSLTLAAPVTLAAGTSYSILQSAACLHEGVHEITAVGAGTIAVRNRSTVKPPINGVSVDEFRIIKTVLKQNGTAVGDDGFVFDQNGSLREVNNLVVVGPGSGTGIGFLLQDRIPSETSSGGTSFGDVTQNGLRGTVLFGQNVGATRFLRAAMIGHGCLLNARKFASTNNLENSVWVLEGGIANLRRAQITGGSGIALLVNAGGTAVVTEIRLAGSGNDGLRTDTGSVVYGEAPMAVACGGMNYRILDSGKVHLTDSVSLLSSLSGVYSDGGGARIDRMAIGANVRAGIEIGDQGLIHADGCWVSGTSAGFGLTIGSGSKFMASGTAINNNASGDVNVPATSVESSITLRNCYYPAGFTGVQRLNSPNGNGSALYDGAGVDIGSSTPSVGGSGGPGTGTGTSSAVSLNWTRDKNRYAFNASVTVNTVGDWSGYLTLSLPFTAAVNCSVGGNNQTTGAGLTGYATGTQLRIYSNTGTFPAAAGNTLLISGVILT
jgi:hypothetical protein